MLCAAGAPLPGTNNSNITVALLLLKTAIDPNGTLTSWEYDTDYCTWQGVQCNGNGVPTSL